MTFLNLILQIVKIGDIESQAQIIECGVPQGSLLGPLFFLIYINDMQEIGMTGDITLYADDTSLFYYGNSIETVINQAQHDIDLLNRWLQSNLLTINASKTNYMIFSARNKKIGNYNPLTINGEPINKVEKEKYLGLIIDNHLTWKDHIEKIRNKLSTLRGALRPIARCRLFD